MTFYVAVMTFSVAKNNFNGANFFPVVKGTFYAAKMTFHLAGLIFSVAKIICLWPI